MAARSHKACLQVSVRGPAWCEALPFVQLMPASFMGHQPVVALSVLLLFETAAASSEVVSALPRSPAHTRRAP
jgi:hypothetical protein